MHIVLIRIDDRLIHGQVVEGWLKTINVNHIVVVSDEVARDKMQQTLLSMAVPSSVKVTILSVDAAVKKILENYFEKTRVLVLLSRPRDAVRLLEGGVKIGAINLGGMHYAQGKRQILRNLSVDGADVEALRSIHRFGTKIEGRVLPSDEMIDVIDILEKELKKDASGAGDEPANS